jgi:hypothetical protein
MYSSGDTVLETLRRIEKHEYVLPAIQREFVWRPEQICRLFDSLMQGYPFGAFLFWRVEPENSGRYKFYDFVRHYHERDNPHCPVLDQLPNQPLIAILDGQQRLTALNIGLRGSMAVKEPNKWWTNPNAFPTRHLYLNLIAPSGEEEEGNRFDFRFLESVRAENRRGEIWFKIGDILGVQSGPTMLRWLTDRGVQGEELTVAYERLDRLHRVVHVERCVAYYQEPSQDLERVLNIFIRMNSGGTVLSYSDLLLSIAVAQWTNLDARKEIHDLVDSLNRIGTGFNFSNDFVLKAGLMLTDIASVGFKVENFNRENMAVLQNSWSGVRQALMFTVQLAASFGFNAQTLRADSALLPLAYYLYRKQPPDNYLTHSSFSTDRETIRGWLVRSLLKASGIWGSGLDTLLTALRSTIQTSGADYFPAVALRETMARRGKTLSFETEEIEELADLDYGDKRLFPLLSILYPFVDLRNQFHMDHIFPWSMFTTQRLRRAGVAEERVDSFRDHANRIANLQLLEGAVNNEKRAKLPLDWLMARYPNTADRQHYEQLQDLGAVPAEITGFDAFYEQRRERLKSRISSMINEG